MFYLKGEMFRFDVAAGVNESTLNSYLPKIYEALYPTFLKDTINFGEVGISSIAFDIQAPPTISLVQSKTCKAASSASFTVTAPKVALTVNYSQSTPTNVPAGSLEVHATVSVDESNSNLTFRIVGGSIDIPQNEVLSELLNKALLPYLISELNKNIFNAVKIPPLEYKSLKLSAPLPVVQQSLLAAFSSLVSAPSTIPGTLSWPKDGVFIAASIDTLEAAAELVFPLGPREKFSWEIVSGDVGATINTPKVTNIANDGTISASIKANASCQLTLQTPWYLPNVSFGPSATLIIKCSLLPSIDDGELKVAFANIPSFRFPFDWGIPGWINWVFDPIEEGLSFALNALLYPLIGDLLKSLAIPILNIPPINIELGGKKMTIQIDQAIPSGIQGSLLLMKAQANIII